MLRGSSKFANISKSIIRNLPLNPHQLKRYIADECCPTQEQQNKKHAVDNSTTALKNDAFTPPAFLPITAYRPLDDPKQVFGPGAHKCKEYKNPEYFACHRYSFYELQNATLELAKNAKGGVLYEAEESDEESVCVEECEDKDGEAEDVKKSAQVEGLDCKQRDDEEKK